MIVTKTPLRLSLFGGSTDYGDYVTKHGGVCVGLALDKYVYVAVKKRIPYGEAKYRVATSTLDLVNSIVEIENPAVRGCLQIADPGVGVEVVHWADMPGRCGVGSSSSFVVGLLNALRVLDGKHLSPREAWKQACHVEQDILNETVGYQDQAWASFGGIGRLDFPAGNIRKVEFTPLSLPPESMSELLSHLTIVYTGTQRTASEAAKQYVNAETTLEKTHIIRAIAEEGWVALQQRDWEKVGSLLDQTWRAKRSVSASMSSSVIDMLYSTARIYNAWGGKLMGAGGGAGCFALMIPPAKRESCLAAIRSKFGDAVVSMPVDYARFGSRIIYAE